MRDQQDEKYFAEITFLSLLFIATGTQN